MGYMGDLIEDNCTEVNSGSYKGSCGGSMLASAKHAWGLWL